MNVKLIYINFVLHELYGLWYINAQVHPKEFVCLSIKKTDRLLGMALWAAKAVYVGLFHACGMHLVRIICGLHKDHILWTDKCTRSSREYVCPSIWKKEKIWDI